MEVASNRDGYVYVLMVGSSNTDSYILFPSEIDKANQIKAGQTLKLPQRGKITPYGPVGVDHLLAVVTDQPISLKSVATKKAGIFKSMAGQKKVMASFQRAVTRNLIAEEDEAPAVAIPAASAEGSAMGFGAAMVQIREIE